LTQVNNVNAPGGR